MDVKSKVRRRTAAAAAPAKLDGHVASAETMPVPPPQPPHARRKSPKRSRAQTFLRRSACLVVLLLVLAALTAGPVVYSIFHGPKPAEEMWIDWQDYARWRVARVLGRPTPCTYGGVRFFAWGQGVASADSDCGCWLHRCPPTPSAIRPTPTTDAATTEEKTTTTTSPAVRTAPSSQSGAPLTVAALRAMCHSVPAYTPQEDLVAAVREAWLSTPSRAPASDKEAGKEAEAATWQPSQPWIDNPLFHRITYPGEGATTDGVQLFSTVPTCVQSGRLYFDVPDPTSTITATDAEDADAHPLWHAFLRGELALDDTPLLSQFQCRAGEHQETPHALTDVVLRRAAKYHPITAVRALGLIVNAKDATSDFTGLIQSVLLPLSHLLHSLAATEQQTASGEPTSNPEAVDADASSARNRAVLFAGWTANATRSWLHSARQVIFVEDVPDSEAMHYPTPASSQLARGFAHSFSTDTDEAASASHPSALFETAPASRVRYGEKSREPMYCFCQSLMVPQVELLSDAELTENAFDSLHRRLNGFFGALPLAEQTPTNLVVSEAARRAAHPTLAERFWSSTTSTTTSDAYRPRLLYLAREDRRVDAEDRLLALLAEVGFAVEVQRAGKDDAPASGTAALSSAEWYHVGRYADVVMGSHGSGLTHAIWMDNTATAKTTTTTEERACRTLVELLPFGNAALVSAVYGDLMTAAGIRYVSVEPTNVRLGEDAFLSSSKFALVQQARRGVESSASLSAAQQRKLERLQRARANHDADAPRVEFDIFTAEDEHVREKIVNARRALMDNAFGPFDLPSFQDQTAVYNWEALTQVVRQLYQNVTQCLSA